MHIGEGNGSYVKSFPRGAVVKNLPVNSGDTDVGLIPGLERSLGVGKWQAASIFLPGKLHGRKSLVSYSPWGAKSWTRLRMHSRVCVNPRLLIYLSPPRPALLPGNHKSVFYGCESTFAL